MLCNFEKAWNRVGQCTFTPFNFLQINYIFLVIQSMFHFRGVRQGVYIKTSGPGPSLKMQAKGAVLSDWLTCLSRPEERRYTQHTELDQHKTYFT